MRKLWQKFVQKRKTTTNVRTKPTWKKDKMNVLLMTVAAALVRVSAAISCYECNSSTNFTCTENWEPGNYVVDQYRNDCKHVFEATYCVKMVGVFEGKLGTKRFCSSRDWGNYCEYIKRPGDIQEYRSCVFSCTTNTCNTGQRSVRASLLSLATVFLPVIVSAILWPSA